MKMDNALQNIEWNTKFVTNRLWNLVHFTLNQKYCRAVVFVSIILNCHHWSKGNVNTNINTIGWVENAKRKWNVKFIEMCKLIIPVKTIARYISAIFSNVRDIPDVQLVVEVSRNARKADQNIMKTSWIKTFAWLNAENDWTIEEENGIFLLHLRKNKYYICFLHIFIVVSFRTIKCHNFWNLPTAIGQFFMYLPSLRVHDYSRIQ